MDSRKLTRLVLNIYVVVFLAYMLLPLVVMGGAALNDSRFPSVYPWVGFTDRWFVELWQDERMWVSFRNTILVAIAVVALSVPIGTAAAILINSIGGTVRSTLYGFMIAPILTPGAVIGISTLLFWNEFSVPAGLHLSTLGQVSYIAAFVMLLVLARLQSFDRALEEAALDLGATPWQAFTRVLVPYLMPAIAAGALMSFTLSLDELIVTWFTASAGTRTLPLEIFGRVKKGLDPSLNAISTLFIALAALAVLATAALRRNGPAGPTPGAEVRR
jgi:spermidine/putrescine transport system permease protein